MQIPDFHPSVVHFPIALLSLGSVAGLLYLFWRPRAELRTLTWWPLFLGWLGALLAILTGLLAQSQLPPTAPYRDTLDIHTYTGFGVAILYAFPLYRRWLYGKHVQRPSLHDKHGQRPSLHDKHGQRPSLHDKHEQRPSLHGQRRRPTDPADLLDAPGSKSLLAAVFAMGLALVLLTGIFGGQLVYRWGVNVQTGF